jgi:hypothetical protein
MSMTMVDIFFEGGDTREGHSSLDILYSSTLTSHSKIPIMVVQIKEDSKQLVISPTGNPTLQPVCS